LQDETGDQVGCGRPTPRWSCVRSARISDGSRLRP